MSAVAVEDQIQAPDASAPPDLEEIKTTIKAALDTYAKREEAIKAIEQRLSQARKCEAENLTASLSSDDAKIVRRIADARVEIEIQSRRKTVAQQSLPDSLEGARVGIIEYFRILNAKVDELVASRLAAHQRFFEARLDFESLRAMLVSAGFGGYMQNPMRLFAEHGIDVINAAGCRPRFIWAINGTADGTGITMTRLAEDIERLAECEKAIAAEVARAYDFEPQLES